MRTDRLNVNAMYLTRDEETKWEVRVAEESLEKRSFVGDYDLD